MEKNIKNITDMEKVFNQRFTRMDNDKNLYLLSKYTLTDEKNKAIPNSISVTLPEPRMFAEKVFAIINSAHMQSRVIGRGLSDGETALIEKCVDDLFTSVDIRLMQRGSRILKPFIIEQDCIRGTIITRNLLKEMPDATYIPDVLPCDARHTVYQFGVDDLLWCAPKFFRSKAMLVSEYPEQEKNIPSGYNIPVYEYADKEVIATYVNQTKIREEENTLGYVPYVVVESATGPMLMDDDYFKYRGESIYAVVRDLYPEINRHASILTTLDMLSFLGGLQFPNPLGDAAEPPKEPLRGMRKTIPMDKDARLIPIPINDVRNSSRMIQYLLLSGLQRATFSNLEYGTLTMPLSAVAISKMMGTRDAIVVMRLHDMGLYFRQTAKMLLRQYVEGGLKAKLGEPGLEREYATKVMDKDFAIFYDFTPVSPEQDIANTAVAQQQRALGLSWRSILTNTLKVQDVAGELEMERREIADRMDIANTLLDQAISYAERGDELDDRAEKELYYTKAELVTQQLETILKQRATGQLTGLNMQGAEPQNGGKPMLPLLGGGRGGQAQPEQEEEVTPDEMEERRESRESVVRRQTEG